MVDKPIPKSFVAKWNNHRSKLVIDLPDDIRVVHGNVYECYVNEDSSILYKKIGEKDEDG